MLGSSHRGVAHPEVLPCDHLPRKTPHTRVFNGSYIVVVVCLWLSLSVVVYVFVAVYL